MINKTETQEKKYLETIKDKILQVIRLSENIARRKSVELQEQKEYVRDNKDEKAILSQFISQTAGSGEAAMAKNMQLRRLQKSPYFGRIDFTSNKQNNPIPVYIGNSALSDEETNHNLIYDWRAPISSLFYDFEIGIAQYNAPTGTVEGTVELKRQYRIKNGQLEFMIDTSAHIHDDLLQKELSLRSTDKMKNIVATIQKDQNAIIRDEDSRILIIQGVAGSGKTSIALHRIAFLLYRFKDNISANDLLIISPNKVFSDYISNVLPELGEENIPETRMSDLVNEILDHKYPFQSFFVQVSILLEKNDKLYKDRVDFKSSFEYVSKLNEYVVYLNKDIFHPAEIKIGKYIIPMQIISDKFNSYHRLPLFKRFDEMVGPLSSFLAYKYRYEVTAKDKSEIKKAISKMYKTGNVLVLYKEFFVWMVRPDLFKMASKGMMEFLDVFGLTYLKICLEGVKTKKDVKHLLIDEMQDYCPVQYAIISKLFSCKMTLLGDINQSINANQKIDLTYLKRIFPQAQDVRLNKSYRSTYEIINLAQQVAYNEELIAIERHGKHPTIHIAENDYAEIKYIKNTIEVFIKEASYKSLALICKTEKEASQLLVLLEGGHFPIQLLTSLSPGFTGGILITSAHLAKGLEFDHVIIPFVNDKNYNTEMDKRMLYIAITRAMHLIDITCTKKLSSFIKQ